MYAYFVSLIILTHFVFAEENKMELDSSPKLLSLAHPLEEMFPVAIKDSTLSLVDSFNLQIVFTNVQPSIAVVYNFQSRNHGVYNIRTLRPGEWEERVDKTSHIHSSINTSNKV